MGKVFISVVRFFPWCFPKHNLYLFIIRIKFMICHCFESGKALFGTPDINSKQQKLNLMHLGFCLGNALNIFLKYILKSENLQLKINNFRCLKYQKNRACFTRGDFLLFYLKRGLVCKRTFPSEMGKWTRSVNPGHLCKT